MQSLLTAVIVLFGFAIVQPHDRWSAEETINGKMNEESKIQDNFHRFLDSIGKNDVRKTKTFRTILEQESANGHQAFDSMKEELQVARQKKVNRQRNLSNRNGNVGENGVPSKREIPDKNHGSAVNEGPQGVAPDQCQQFWSNRTTIEELKRRVGDLRDENIALEKIIVEIFGEVDFPGDRVARIDLLKEILEVAFDFDKREPFLPEKFGIYYLFFGNTPTSGCVPRGIHPVVVSQIEPPFKPDGKTMVRWIAAIPMKTADEWLNGQYVYANDDLEICRLSLEVNGNTSFVLYDVSATHDSRALLYRYARKYGSFGSINDHPPCLERAITA